jgi:hypothetical protein
MGFNYLQTDDRDDYFAQFGKKSNGKNIYSVNLISPTGETIMEDVSTFRLKAYAKKHYIPFGTGAKKIWRNVLISKGYTITNNYN